MNRLVFLPLVFCTLALAGCFGPGNDDLQQFLQDAKAREADPVEPAPDVPVVQSYAYSAQENGERSPFIFAEEELPESLPGFDLADGLTRLQGNKKLYRKLLLSFATDYCETANDIRIALDADFVLTFLVENDRRSASAERRVDPHFRRHRVGHHETGVIFDQPVVIDAVES